MSTMIWIIIMIAAIIVEASSCALLSIWFAVGALSAAIASWLGAGMTVQLIIFFGVSVVLLAATRPVLRKLLPKKYIPTNGELDIGKTAVVIETIDSNAHTGRVRLEGVDWGAVSADGSVISKGASVIITDKGAARLTVKAQ